MYFTVDFGVVDKLELGPKLEHVTKSRPKPVGRRRPSRKPVMLDETDGRGTQSAPLHGTSAVSNGDTKKAAAESTAAKKEETDGRNSPKGAKSSKKQAAQPPSASKNKK